MWLFRFCLFSSFGVSSSCLGGSLGVLFFLSAC